MARKSNECNESVSACRYSNYFHKLKDFACFDALRKIFYKKDSSVKSKIILFFCGAASGATAITVTTPV